LLSLFSSFALPFASATFGFSRVHEFCAFLSSEHFRLSLVLPLLRSGHLLISLASIIHLPLLPISSSPSFPFI